MYHGDYVSTKEAARLLGYSIQHIRLLIRNGQLRAEMFGRDWMIDKSSALAIQASALTTRTESPNPASPTNSKNRLLLQGTEPWTTISQRSKYAGSRHCLLLGDAQTCLSAIPDKALNTCLTSPPYWGARDYGNDEQIGLENRPSDYIRKIVDIFREVKRVLRDDGTAWLNVGDCYLNGCSTRHETWQKNKQLGLIPFRLAIALQDDGWLVRNTVVWHKPNAMPASVRDRLTTTWEPVFLLTKNEKYYFNLDAIRVPHKTDDQIERSRAENGGGNGKAKGRKDLRVWLTSPRHRAAIDGLKEIRRRPNAPVPTELAQYLRDAAEDKGFSIRWVAEQLGEPFERVRHYFRTDVIGSRLPPEETWEALKELLELDTKYDDAMAVEIGDNVFRNHPNGRNPGDVQSISLSGRANDHFATMPERLARWCLRASLPEDGICLDPFMGTGTTGRVTLELGGRFVGIDIRTDFLQQAQQALQHQCLVPYDRSLSTNEDELLKCLMT